MRLNSSSDEDTRQRRFDAIWVRHIRAALMDKPETEWLEIVRAAAIDRQ